MKASNNPEIRLYIIELINSYVSFLKDYTIINFYYLKNNKKHLSRKVQRPKLVGDL